MSQVRLSRPSLKTVVLSAVVLLASPALTACVETAMTGAAVVGTTALQDRGVKGATVDTAIRAEINHYWLEKDHRMWMALHLQVYEGRVLVSGTLANPDERADAVQLAWKAKGVKEVIDEVQVANSQGVGDYARDTAIHTELDARLLFAKGVESVNYSTVVENGVIYILGVAQNQTELDRVLNIARNIKNVKKVISHVIMRDDPKRFRSASAS
jgi:osmotically-inducible protein OsmY